MKIEVGKKYKTRDGRLVKLYYTNGGGRYPIHGSVYFNDIWEPVQWECDGYENSQHNWRLSLVELREQIKRTYWVNVYKKSDDTHLSNISYGFTSKEEADEIYADELKKGIRDDDRIACVQVTLSCMEGDGLEDKL